MINDQIQSSHGFFFFCCVEDGSESWPLLFTSVLLVNVMALTAINLRIHVS